MSMRGVTLSVSDAVFLRLIERGRKLGLTPNAYAQTLFEQAYAASCGVTIAATAPATRRRQEQAAAAPAPADTITEIPEERSGTAREAPSTPAEQPAAEPVVEAVAAVEVQPAAPSAEAAPAPREAGAATAELTAQQRKTARLYRGVGNTLAEVAALTGFSLDQVREACRGMR